MAFRTRKGVCPCCHLHNSTIFSLPTGLPSINPSSHLGDLAAADNAIRTQIESAESRLRMLDSAIKRLDSQRRYISRVYIAHRKSLLSPITRIPDDVLLNIFEFYLRVQPSIPFLRQANSTRGIHPTPFTLTMVSRRWRSLTLSYQSLWSIIPTRSEYQAGIPGCNPEHTLVVQLDRSGSHPLSVDFSKDYQASNNIAWADLFMMSERAVQRVINQAIRWVELRLTEPVLFLGATNVSHRVSSFPSLRKLTVDYATVGTRLEHNTLTSTSAPLLEDLTLFQPIIIPEVDVTALSSPSSLPFTQLRRFSLTCTVRPLEVTKLFMVLQCCSNLEELDIHTPSLRQRQPIQDLLNTKLFLPKLKSAKLSAAGGTIGALALSHVIRRLHLPALRSLSMAPPVNLLLKHLYPLIQRSGCDIRNLTLVSNLHRSELCPGNSNYTALPSLLASMQNLDRLTVVTASSRLVTTIFESLIRPSRPGSKRAKQRCSRLRELILETRDFTGSLNIPQGSKVNNVISSTFLDMHPPVIPFYEPFSRIQFVSMWGIELVWPSGHQTPDSRRLCFNGADFIEAIADLGRILEATVDRLMDSDSEGSL